MTTTTSAATPTETAAAGAIDAVKLYGEGDTEIRALDGVTVSFERSRFTAIMGPSGSGKSTLMHCLAGLDQLSSGRVFIGDTYLDTLSESQLTELRRDSVGFVFQAFNLIPTLTAEENITLPLDIARRPVDRDWFDTVVDAVGLRDRLDHRPGEIGFFVEIDKVEERRRRTPFLPLKQQRHVGAKQNKCGSSFDPIATHQMTKPFAPRAIADLIVVLRTNNKLRGESPQRAAP